MTTAPESVTEPSASGLQRGEIGPGSVFANASQVVFQGAPAFYSIQGSYVNHASEQPHHEADSTVPPNQSPTAEDSVSISYIREKTSVELYRGLDKKRLGVALHIPQPNARLSKAARRKGVCIGSVGKVTQERSFDCMFNICNDADDPVNPVDLHLSGFTPIQPSFSDHDIREFKEFSSGSFLGTRGIYRLPAEGTSERSIASFGSIGSQEGALLVLPNGGYVEQLTNRPRLFDYIEHNASSLYAYANNTRNRQFKNGELSVVSSCRKSTSWGIATFQNTSGSPTMQADLLNQHPSRHSLSAGSHFTWNCRGAVEAKVGPEDDNDDLGDDGVQPGTLRNQCLFVRSIRIKLAHSEWRNIRTGKNILIDSYAKDGFLGVRRNSRLRSFSSVSTPSDPLGSPALSSSSFNGNADSPATPLSQYESDGDLSFLTTGEEDERDNTDSSSLLTDTLMDVLLQARPDARIAILPDDDWNILSSEDRSPYDVLEFVQNTNDICERHGITYFEPKEECISQEKRDSMVRGLDRGTIPLSVYLFGCLQSRRDRCTFLGRLIEDLQSGSKKGSSSQHNESLIDMLPGHPRRHVPLDEVFEAAPFYIACPSPPIRALRENVAALQAANASDSNALALHSQRLGESLLSRYILHGRLDDLHEAVWALADVLALHMRNPPSATTGSYRHLELLLDLASALYFRYQLLQSENDLHALLCVLQCQKDTLSAGAEAYSWIWSCDPHSQLSTTMPRVYMVDESTVPNHDAGSEECLDYLSHEDAINSLLMGIESSWNALQRESSDAATPRLQRSILLKAQHVNIIGGTIKGRPDRDITKMPIKSYVPAHCNAPRGRISTLSSATSEESEDMTVSARRPRYSSPNHRHKRGHSDIASGSEQGSPQVPFVISW